jgi:hypothetical protein
MKNRTQGALLRRLLDGLGVVLVVALLATGGSVRAAPEPRSDATALPPLPMNEQVLNLPGDPARPVTLQVTLFMPYGAGPFPLAVVNHGRQRTDIRETNRGIAPLFPRIIFCRVAMRSSCR